MTWLSITLDIDAGAAEEFSEALLEAGAASVSMEPSGAGMRLGVLAAADADAAALVAAAATAAAIAAPAYRTEPLEDEDWVRRSQAQFGPIRISDALWIVPSWHTPPAGAHRVVRLDPGLAFGTGSHVSTRLVLQHLEARVQRGKRVLDYGCGSGILAIVAGLLGASEIVATDIDPLALETTVANAAQNSVAVSVAAPDRLPSGTFDLVLANILAGPLIALEPLLASRACAGGRVLLSGILKSQAAEVSAAYARDFEMSLAAEEEGWTLLEGMRR